MLKYNATGKCIVLERQTRGEKHLLLACLSQSLGLMYIMKRLSNSKTSPLPDLFDDIDGFTYISSEQSPKFLHDFQIIKRRLNLIKRYDAFQIASEIADKIIKNARNIEDIPRLYFYAHKAIDALDSLLSPQAVRIKFLYALTKQEGYPVIEDFYENLSKPMQQLFAYIVKTPTKDMPEIDSRAEAIADKFVDWIKFNTDII